MQEFVAFSIVIVLLLAGYWSLVIFPRQRTFKKHNQYVRTMQVGDEVITLGGIIGELTALDPDSGIAYVKIAEGIEVKMLSVTLDRPFIPEEVSISARIGVEPGIEAQMERRGS
jgi:preprotein translocase subunit YajC